jgi:hypothetical protein
MLGTFVSIVSVSIMAMHSFSWSAAALTGLAQALVPALLMNVAIVGINQIYDVDIDKVNKPYLPLASGELSMTQGGCVDGGRGVHGSSCSGGRGGSNTRTHARCTCDVAAAVAPAPCPLPQQACPLWWAVRRCLWPWASGPARRPCWPRLWAAWCWGCCTR